MTLDPATEFANKDEFDRQQAIKHQAMDDLIRSSETKFLTLEHNGKSIRIRPAIPGKAKQPLIQLASKYKGIDIEALKRGEGDLSILPELQKDEGEALYSTLAAICFDAPYNDPESWRYYDENTGEARLIFEKVEGLMKEAHDTAVSFRPKS